MWKSFLRDRRPWVVILEGTATVALIAFADRRIHAEVPLALLYLLPAAYVGTGLSRWQLPIFGGFCTFVAEWADAFSWSVAQGIPRDALYFAAYTAAGLYVSEVLANRRRERAHLHAVKLEGEVRQQAEEQLRLLIATSSIAIITSDDSGSILFANDAAERLFGGGGEGLALHGKPIASLIPVFSLASLMKRGQRQFKTMMQCEALRSDLEPFFADVWFSTYRTAEGDRLTAMVIDSSKEVRDREEANLEQVLTGLRLLVGSVSHEIRNICAAIGLVQQNLGKRRPELECSEDFQALRQLTSGLERLAAAELSQVKHQASHVHLSQFLRDLRIIVGPSLREAGMNVEWDLREHLPTVWADQQGLLQIFLNLIRNAEAALANTPKPKVSISITRSRSFIEVRVADNGPGIKDADHLFHPLRVSNQTSGRVGMGLYLSRALVTSFRGDLRYESTAIGATFVIELQAVESLELQKQERCL